MKKWMNYYCNILALLFVMPSYAFAGGEFAFVSGSLLISLLVMAVVFLILREFFCWYWKINERLLLLKEIRDLLKKNGRLSSPFENKSELKEIQGSGDPAAYCPGCQKYDAHLDVYSKLFCPNCKKYVEDL